MSSRIIPFVIVLAIISLVGLSVVQFQWLSDSVQLHRRTFYQQVDLATKMAGAKAWTTRLPSKLPNDTSLPYPLHREVTAAIDSALNEYNITATYTYGLYEHRHPQNSDCQYHWVSGTAIDRTPVDLSCEPQQRTFGWANLACEPPKTTSYSLGLFFPNDDLYLLSTMKDTWLTTLLFIILLIICFAYTIATLRKQKKLSDMKSDFINNLTHEFKTPLFSIDLAASMLQKAPELRQSDKLLRYAEVIDSEGKRLSNQVDKVLQVALVDSDNFRLEKKQIDIHTLLRKVVGNFALPIQQRGGTITLHLEAQRPLLYADETHINNVLYNLLENAQKYSVNQPKVVVTTRDQPNGLQLSIQDYGIGIAPSMQQHIFDKFYRGTTNVSEIKGFGLGLSYVKSVIDAHGARIRLTSVPQVGSTFTLTFDA